MQLWYVHKTGRADAMTEYFYFGEPIIRQISSLSKLRLIQLRKPLNTCVPNQRDVCRIAYAA